MRSFKGTIIISRKYSQPSILLTVLCILLTLKFEAIQFYQSTFSFRIWEHHSRETNFLSKRIYFHSSIDYIETRAIAWSNYFVAVGFFSEYVVVWSSYFFLIISLGNKHFLLISYFLKINTFFSTATVSEGLFLQNK